jgi:hypothetical protein
MKMRAHAHTHTKLRKRNDIFARLKQYQYEGVSKSFRTGCLQRELQMVQLFATRCSCTAILLFSLVSFAATTLCVASQQVFVVLVVYFVIYSVRKLLGTPSYVTFGNHCTKRLSSWICCSLRQREKYTTGSTIKIRNFPIQVTETCKAILMPENCYRLWNASNESCICSLVFPNQSVHSICLLPEAYSMYESLKFVLIITHSSLSRTAIFHLYPVFILFVFAVCNLWGFFTDGMGQ